MSQFKLRSRLMPVVAAAVLALSSQGSAAGEVHITCPASLESTSIEVRNAPGGWTPFVAATFPLNSAGPMDGPPSLLGNLKEISRSKKGGKIFTKWEMTNEDNAYPDGKWISCKYGSRNEIVIAKRVDNQTTACTSITTEDKTEGTAIEIRCK
jgi:hypothetical protein